MIETTEQPFGEYVPEPRSLLHSVDYRIKLLWILSFFFLLRGSTSAYQLGLMAFINLVTIWCVPEKLWKLQFKTLYPIVVFLFIISCISGDTWSPLRSTRIAPIFTSDLHQLPNTKYNYRLFKFFFIEITRRSLRLAINVSTITFTIFQAANICLLTTKPSSINTGVRFFLKPLSRMGLSCAELCFRLMLSLRFLALVFQQLKFLSQGIIARNVDWRSQGLQGTVRVFGLMFSKACVNLFQECVTISQALKVRGFKNPSVFGVYYAEQNLIRNTRSILSNLLAFVLLLVALAIRIHFN